ncbi:hypothetical protein JCM8547_008707 [Rhodosporidiobolus lusitaniae]
MGKRTRSHVDLTQSSSDSDGANSGSESDYSPTSSPSRRPPRRKKSHKTPKSDELSASQRLANASPWLAPRSKLFDGEGIEGNWQDELRIRIRKHGEEDGVVGEDGMIVAASSSAVRKREAKEAQATLTFSPGKGAISSEEQLETLRGAAATRRKPTRTLKTTQRTSSNWDSIVGDADKQVARALVASPSIQLPWQPSRFAMPKQTKPREPKINSPPKKKKDDSGAERKKKRKRKSGPLTTRLYSAKIPLLALHREDLKGEMKKPGFTTHKVEGEVKPGKTGELEAKFAVLVCRDSTNCPFLRFAVYSAENDPVS